MLIATGIIKPRLSEVILQFDTTLIGRVRNLDNQIKRGNLKYIEGIIEDLPLDKIAAAGSVRLITDVFGPISYSTELRAVLSLYARLLMPGGRAYIKVDDRLRSLRLIEKMGTGIREYYADYDLFEFVAKKCRGFTVEGEGARRYLVRNHDEIFIPQLELVRLRVDTPPEIVYEIEAP